ncbi:MAG: S26 family signal peptidase [Saprospiraceae bacterium]|nr:S26 family signal peptidase [Saprospiraceae bacterium]
MTVLIFLIVLYFLLGLSMMKLFEKAGIPGWKALVPGLAAVEWCKMVGRKPAFAAWLLFPVVNLFIYAGLCIDMVRSFGKHGFWDAVLSVVYAPIPFFLIGRNPKDRYNGPILDQEREYHQQVHEATEQNDKAALRKLEATNPFKKSQLREWSEAIIFAVFAAAFIRMFLIEAYVIPTSSMEGSLKVGDYLFVSKAHYGIRTPMTVLQFPLIHNRFSNNEGLLARESYLRNPSLPYFRLPAIEQVDHNEPVVFNFPAGDSVIITPNRTYDVYQWRREIDMLRRLNRPTPPMPEVVARPIDKKDHYIKRCIGMPGDSLQIRDGQVYLNGKAATNPTHMQFAYYINTPAGNLSLSKLEEIGVSLNDAIPIEMPTGEIRRYFNLDVQQVEKVKSWGADITLERFAPGARPGYVFPNDAERYGNWSVDNFGPIYIPKQGTTVELSPANLPFYERIIRVYEGNDMVIRDGKYFINGQEATTYTFKQDYFWMMGDNRHNSEDSRIWGYVPEDHIVGKPLFIWFSTKNGNIREGINWSRIFRSANQM